MITIILDVNECLSNATHSCSQLCTNTIGSYDCSCYEGYTKMSKYSCFGKIIKPQKHPYGLLLLLDINECLNASLNNCTGDQKCINTMGSYRCECPEGYEFKKDGISCQRKYIELLRKDIVYTIAKQCSYMLQRPRNGQMSCPDGNRTTDTCYFTCDIGYSLVGSVQRICQSNGQWSGVMTCCDPLPCPDPVPPANGYIQLPCSQTYQSNCTVRCFNGYKIVNTSNTITCTLSVTNDTEWSKVEDCKGNIYYVAVAVHFFVYYSNQFV